MEFVSPLPGCLTRLPSMPCCSGTGREHKSLRLERESICGVCFNPTWLLDQASFNAMLFTDKKGA